MKASQFGDGLHVFGRGEQGAAERNGLLAGRTADGSLLDHLLAPSRTNRCAADGTQPLHDRSARSTFARSMHRASLAEELLRRHLQDHGDYPRGLVVDLWGSATMRTAGEEFAMALHLLGAKPMWDMASERVTGVGSPTPCSTALASM